MKKLLSAFAALFVFGSVQAQTLLNAGKLEGSLSTNAHITKTHRNESSDNFYIAGWFTDSLDVDVTSGVHMLQSDFVHKSSFVAKYDPAGYLQWALCFTSSADSVIINDVFEDNGTGEVYIGGTFNGTFVYDPLFSGSGFSAGTQAHGFIGKYNSSGYVIDAAMIGDPLGICNINSIAPGSGSVLAGGWFSGTVDFEPSATVDSRTAVSGKDAFVANYTFFAAPSATDIHQFGNGTGDEMITNIMYNDGLLYFAGEFTGGIDIDLGPSVMGTISTAGGTDVFFAKYDLGFDLVYGHYMGGTGNDHIKGLDNHGSSYFLMALEFAASVNVNVLGTPLLLTSNGSSDVAFLRYDMSTGLISWARNVGDTGPNTCDFIGTDFYDHYYIGVNYSGPIDMDPGPGSVNETVSSAAINAAIVEFDTDGNYKTHYKTEGSSVKAFCPSIGDNNNVIMVGEFTGTNIDVMPFDSTEKFTHPTNTALFFNYFNRCHLESATLSVGGPFECFSCNITLAITATGGVAPYEGSWPSEASGMVMYNQCPGTYYASVYDYHGCWIETNEIYISDHDGYPFDATIAVTPTSCGDNLGEASATFTDNMGAVSYNWSNGDTTAVADSLESGTYTLLLSDTTGCYITESFVVNNTDGPSISVTSTSNPNCHGAGSGSVDINVTGGTLPYTFLWSNGATTEDLSGVAAGTYAVIVTDASGCSNQLCIDLTSPEAMSVAQLSGSYSDCLLSNGSISVMAFGGVEPYTFQWDAAAGSQTSDSAINLAAGMYTLTVTDANGCSVERTFGVSDNTGPSVYVYDYWYPSCYYGPGYIDMDVFSGSGIYTYLWSEGSLGQDLLNVYGGEYLQTTTDVISGCKTTYSFLLEQYPPYAPEICMVTVDSSGTHNVVVWDKTLTPDAAYFKVYREGFCSSADFLPVGIVPYDSLSVFEDTVVNTETRSWKYYLTAVDSCGYESEPSTVNKTIHLTSVYDDVTNNVVLNWEAYVGQGVTQYNIYRVDPSDSTVFTLIDSVSGLILAYEDNDDLSAYVNHDLEYYIEAIPDYICYASRAFNQNASRSNHTRLGLGTIDTTGTSDLLPILDRIQVYPNPANDRVNIRVSSTDVTYEVVILNQMGQAVGRFALNGRSSFSTRELQQGVYFLQVSQEQRLPRTFKLIVSH